MREGSPRGEKSGSFLGRAAGKLCAAFCSLAFALCAQALFLPAASAAENSEVSAKEVNLGKKLVKGVVETKLPVLFAAPSSLKNAEMRRVQIARYEIGKRGEAFLLTSPVLDALSSAYLKKRGYAGFGASSPLQSELKREKFIFSKISPALKGPKELRAKKALEAERLSFALYLEKAAEKGRLKSKALSLTFSPSRPEALAALQAGGWLFYSANGEFLPQIAFTKGAKVKNLAESDTVDLSLARKSEKPAGRKPKPAPKKEAKPLKAEAKKGKAQSLRAQIRKKAFSSPKDEKRPPRLQNSRAPKTKRASMAAVEAPMVHVLQTGLKPPEYMWGEKGTWITAAKSLSFSVGEMNPISYQVGTEFPNLGQMAVYMLGRRFSFTDTPGLGESVMLDTLQVGGVGVSQIRSSAGWGSVEVSWEGRRLQSLSGSIKGNGAGKLEVSLSWSALNWLDWNGSGISPNDGSSTGSGNLSVLYPTYFALDFLGYLNLEAKGAEGGISNSARVLSPFGASQASSVAVYTNGSANGSRDCKSSGAKAFRLNMEGPAPDMGTSNAGLWWRVEVPKEGCAKENEIRFSVASLSKALDTGPGSSPSSGTILSGGSAYLEPAGGSSANPLDDGPSGSEFAGWSWGAKPFGYACAGSKETPGGSVELFEIGGIANGVYIVSPLASENANSSLPSFFITVSHSFPNSYARKGANTPYGLMDPKTATLRQILFCDVKELPFTGGGGAAEWVAPAAFLLAAGACGSYLAVEKIHDWKKPKKPKADS